MEHPISIVIPFHNEAGALPELIRRLDAALAPLTRWYEVIMIDDVSTDDSAGIVERAARDREWLKLIRLPERGGQTGAFRAAFAAAHGEWIIRMDSDLQDDPRELPAFLAKIDSGSDLVIGFRDERKHRLIDKLLTAAYDLLVVVLFNPPVRSFSGSFVAMRSRCVKDVTLWPNDHRYLPLIALRRGAVKIDQVIVTHQMRVTGESKYRAWRKLMLGPPELLRFFLRFRRGAYDDQAVASRVHDLAR